MSAWKVETRRHDSGHAVHLIVGVQSFALPCGDGSYDEATWWAEQLRHAIEAIERGALEEVRRAAVNYSAARETLQAMQYQCVDGGDRKAAAAQRDVYDERLADLVRACLPSCSGCEPGSEGTHAAGTKEHP